MAHSFSGSTSTVFQTFCDGWLDDGFGNYASDPSRPVSLVYNFFIRRDNVSVPLFRGGKCMYMSLSSFKPAGPIKPELHPVSSVALSGKDDTIIPCGQMHSRVVTV